MLTAIYFMLRDAVPWRNLGPQHLDQRHRARSIRRLLRRLEDLGCHVSIATQAAEPTVIGQTS